MSAYSDTRKETAQKMGAIVLCNQCQANAPWQTLSDHGGTCYRCFALYCRTETPAPGGYGIENGPRAWAHRLKAREALGERLSGVQKAAWREVLPQA